MIGGVRAERAIIPTPKFWAVEKLSKNLFPVGKFSSRYVPKFYAKNLHFKEILSSQYLQSKVRMSVKKLQLPDSLTFLPTMLLIIMTKNSPEKPIILWQ